MLQISASGTPSQIGFSHGTLASTHIARSLTFYSALFLKKCTMDWPAVKGFAMQYHPFLSANFPQYVEEMEGVAKGAGKEYADILALNVRTEIAFGAYTDGCTAISWKSTDKSYLGQNWDWDTVEGKSGGGADEDDIYRQSENLICLKIVKGDGLTMQMITEAGIIGKIGMNSHGVGCTLNAVTAKGVSFSKLPCHLALRSVLDSSSRAEAIATLEKWGVASSCHILVADTTGGTGLECSSEDIVQLVMDEVGVVAHTNHYVLPHKKGVVEKVWLPDTNFRLRKAGESLKGKQPSDDVLWEIFRDEVEEDGASICRKQTEVAGPNALATLFGIVMDLGEKKAEVLVGRPIEPTEKLVFSL
ncbi:Acyl-coenzyme A:6-aminopenicillanic-acid-acyltransferase 40 kDa form [Lachnellula hyalina]|uniref:Acyl-coenzyme A:6-aminopenicillanic-acid-acyltransferase 40 kDa form n=1 Tax=Lachnellula hyalina TaxID=1316788 RepID=A0A8H8R9R0_9HELO|nr:Acyl-coenzyme A:6-aminopenicillanic-acid-acyltransferase 40 kDa form [Lachnellula hyalina]TVY30262.1 Acyl-coenzyme A:6-aminopenicillanic-acid-acyltransferase 40 kDa form [Lachnellula hyalina]